MDDKAKVGGNSMVELDGAETPTSLSHLEAVGGCDDMTTPAAKRNISPAFQFYPKDFVSSTKVQRMSLEARGAYIMLLSFCWLDESLPSSHAELARIVGMPTRAFVKVWNGALGECFKPRGDRLINNRLERERKTQAEYRSKKQAAAHARWIQDGAGASRVHHADGVQTPMQTDALLSSSASASPSAIRKDVQTAPIHDQRGHRNHASCGRVCVPAFLHDEFRKRRNHDNADMELRDWYLVIDVEWAIGGPKADQEPGEPLSFWRARYEEHWPSPAAGRSKQPAWMTQKSQTAVPR